MPKLWIYGHGLPISDIALCRGKGDANLGDGAAIKQVLLGIAKP